MSDISKLLSLAEVSRLEAMLGLAQGASVAALGSSLFFQASAHATQGASSAADDDVVPCCVAVPQSRIDDL